MEQKLDFNFDISTENYNLKTKTWSNYEEKKISKYKHEIHRAPIDSNIGKIFQIIYQNKAYRVRVSTKKNGS